MPTEKVSTDQPYTTNSIISKDGTTIGYWQVGKGPAAILVHGGLMSSLNFMKLALALADSYTVYVPDRRGRGLSGPNGNQYCISRECEDIEALVNRTGVQNIFGLSSGAIVTLYSALLIPSLRKVAVYEPPLLLNGARPNAWVPRYERELAQGKLADAFVSIMKGTGDNDFMSMIPRFILTSFMRVAIKADAKQDKEGTVSLAALVPTMHYDAMLIAETKERTEDIRQLKADVFLMGGSKSHKELNIALNGLKTMLPHARNIEFPGVGHIAADNSGKPELVATKLKSFFA